MAVLPVRKIATAGILSAVAIVLGVTHLGFIPWFSGASITVMHVPVIIGAILEGPVVGAFIGLLFGLFSLLQAAIAPTGPVDTAFVNPLISVLPRLLIGPAAWFGYRIVRSPAATTPWRESAGVVLAALVGSVVNSALVLTGLGVFGFFPWSVIAVVALANGPGEAVMAAIISLAVIVAWKRVPSGGSRLSRDEERGA